MRDPSPSAPRWPGVLFWTAAIAYVVAFLAYFHSARLYGTGETDEGRQRRYYILGAALTPSPDGAFVNLAERLGHTEHLWQRTRLLANAGAIWGVAITLGDAFLALVLGRRRLDLGTRLVFAFGLGMGLLSLTVLGLGLAGALTQRAVRIAAVAAAVAWLVLRITTLLRAREAELQEEATGGTLGWKSRLLLLVIMLIFGATSFLSACLPTVDYDALGYHLLAPREWFAAGRISFLPHNVYASFPFLTEMFHLLGMVQVGDWYWGGLIGQVVLWAFGPLGALAVGRLAARLFGAGPGWAAALIYLTTPWVFRLSGIPYVEGASLFYGTLAVLALVEFRGFVGLMLVGAAVGCATACKYTSLLMLGAPVGAAVVWQARQSRSWRPVVGFGLGVVLFFGPWLVRNFVWTGNPVYPLAYSLLDGTNWTPEKAAKFAAGHRSTDFRLSALLRYLAEIPVHSDWQSGLVFAFAPLPLMVCLLRRRTASSVCTAVWALAALVGWQFLAFWIFTHRLDRFWLPLLPTTCVLAGAGWSAIPAGLRGWLVNPLVGVVLLYNFAYCTTNYCALNRYDADLAEHLRFSKSAGSKAVTLADESGLVPAGATVLYVGFAGVYYSEHPFRYNSVFDDPILELLAADPAAANGLRPPEEIRRRFHESGIQYVLVDWEWINKYKSPGNYGYSAFVSPERFAALVSAGVLMRVFTDERVAPDPKRPGPQLEIYRVLGGGDAP